ncbi:MAG: menaquinone biosynthesis protein [bacterium]
MDYRVAGVSFLNTIPLIEGLKAEPGWGELSLEIPSALADRLADGRTDVALVPAAEILRGRTGGLLSPTGIACKGPVNSVALFAAGSPADLDRVRADRGSRSSVALLKILLAEVYGVFPEFVTVEPEPGRPLPTGEGALIIGDRCFAQQAFMEHDGCNDLKMFDLGELWLELTGLPFVFAAWAAAPDLARRRPPVEVAGLGRLLTEARDYGLVRLDELAAREASHGKLGHGGEASPEAIAYYFKHSLRFVIGEEELAGMKRFHELCRQHGLAPDLPFPELLFPRS